MRNALLALFLVACAPAIVAPTDASVMRFPDGGGVERCENCVPACPYTCEPAPGFDFSACALCFTVCAEAPWNSMGGMECSATSDVPRCASGSAMVECWRTLR